ncbi:hypothetical protein QZH41_011171 [Actinostola sp. cb2023]|nr:hypothetical protein QZH41_011171 [Actinostola sp. cb2023]
MELEEGDVLEGSAERWGITRFLGQGKCCSVYEVCDQDDRMNGRRAAVKVYKKDEKYASAGMNEAQLLQMLHIKEKDDDQSTFGRLFIVSLLDVFHCEGHLCLLNASLSYSLHNIFTMHGCHGNGLPLYIVQACCKDLANGLEYLKKKHVIHADIKLTNIMWNSESEVFQFVDFGLSFIEGKQPPQQIQSPGYQAPEVQEWNKNIATSHKKVSLIPHYRWICAAVLVMCGAWLVYCFFSMLANTLFKQRKSFLLSVLSVFR